jgi:hypothetical protein
VACDVKSGFSCINVHKNEQNKKYEPLPPYWKKKLMLRLIEDRRRRVEEGV